MREIVRDRKSFAMGVLFPLVFLVIFSFAFGSPRLATHTVLVQNNTPAGEAVIKMLLDKRYNDGRAVFEIKEALDQENADTILREREASAMLILDLPNVTLRGDAVNMKFIEASRLIGNAIDEHAGLVSGEPEVVSIVEKSIAKKEPETEFDLYAPGIIIFALLLMVPQTALIAAREIRSGTLRRLRLTRVKAGDFLAGISIAQMALAIVQVLLIFAVAPLLGFHNQGSPGIAVLVALAVSFSAIGSGLVVACFIKNDSQASNIGSVVAMVQVFLSGAFFALPMPALFHFAGHEISFFDIFPATHGMMALQGVLSYGAEFHEISFRLCVTVIMSILYFAAGVAVFQQLKMKEG